MRRASRWIAAGLFAAVLATALAVGPASGEAGTAQPAGASVKASSPEGKAFNVARRYLVRFWPRWFTWRQSQLSVLNRLVGPDRVSPRWGIVVAPNDDTFYVTAQVDLSKGPQVLTIPETDDVYSLLTLDVFGSVFESGIPTDRPGTYALVRPGWHGDLPGGVQRVEVPYRESEWIIRADKYAADGTDKRLEALRFRSELRFTSLSDYRSDPDSGHPLIVPVGFYSPQVKTMADTAVYETPIGFLRQMQDAVDDPGTEPMTRSDRRLAQRFDRIFDSASGQTQARMINAIQAGHSQILNRWMTHTGATNWIYFDNIGDWGDAFLDRAALTEFIQLGNDAAVAGYYTAFTDRRGVTLDCSTAPAYILHFGADELPDAKRFWSLTAYLPDSGTLVPNEADKYVVAGYTPGLHRAEDGSVTIYIQPERPTAVPDANWLPVPEGKFELLLRVYGPAGNTKPGSRYTPPGIRETLAIP